MLFCDVSLNFEIDIKEAKGGMLSDVCLKTHQKVPAVSLKETIPSTFSAVLVQCRITQSNKNVKMCLYKKL